MASRKQLEQSLEQYLQTGDQRIILPWLSYGVILVPILIEYLIDRFALINSSNFGHLDSNDYKNCFTLSNRIWVILKKFGEDGLLTIRQTLIKESRLYRNVILYIISTDDKPDKDTVSILHSLIYLPKIWTDEPMKVLMAKIFHVALEDNPFDSFQKQYGYHLSDILNEIDRSSIDYIFEHLSEHMPGNLTEHFLSDQTIKNCRIMADIDSWQVRSNNLVNENDISLFHAPIDHGFLAPSIRLKKVIYKDFSIKEGLLLATASHIIVYESRKNYAFGFPYREIMTVNINGEMTSIQFGDKSMLNLFYTYPRPGIIGAIAILGAPPEEKHFHYAIEQDRKNIADNFMGLWKYFFNEILDVNRNRRKNYLI
jgi:hypothetical protein